jgi:predicted transposase YbfD/YdcC
MKTALCWQKRLVAKSNETTATPLLLESLDLRETTISIDGAGCQKSIVEIIRNKKSHYVLGLKRNQSKLYKAVDECNHQQGEADNNRFYDSFDPSHGRSVRRRYFSCDLTALL